MLTLIALSSQIIDCWNGSSEASQLTIMATVIVLLFRIEVNAVIRFEWLKQL